MFGHRFLQRKKTFFFYYHDENVIFRVLWMFQHDMCRSYVQMTCGSMSKGILSNAPCLLYYQKIFVLLWWQ